MSLCESGVVPRESTIHHIQDVVGNHFGMYRAELLSRRRMAEEVKARHIAIYLCKRLTTQSTKEIAYQFGGKDHSTALHAVRKIERLMKSDIGLRALVQQLARECGCNHELDGELT